MATLTGNKIKDTYSSLIKFSDNGIASGTLQLLSDGAGNSIGISVDTSGNISSAAVGTLIGTSSTDVVGASLLNVSGNGTSGQSLLSDGDGSFSWGSPSVTIADGSITTAKLADDAVTTVKITDANVTTAKLADDNVTFAKLEDRYTVLSALGSGTSFSLDFSAATTFTATASGAATFTFSNAVQGQVIDLILTGNFAITFSETGATFNKVGSTDYDGASNNLIQIVCTDDSSGAKIYHYSIATYTADPTP